MTQQFADDFGGQCATHVMNIDVRAAREFSHEVTEYQREQGRIDWRVRCSANMKKMAKHEINQIYQ